MLPIERAGEPPVTTRALVVGGSGFVGSAVCGALTARGAEVRAASAPRLAAVEAGNVRAVRGDISPELAAAIGWAQVVVNAAGIAEASSTAESELVAANAAVPLVLARAARAAGVQRFVQVSSAAVQGDQPVLDESPRTSGFSPYSRSKALGEQVLRELEWPDVVIYRPQGVHGSSRRVTQTLARVARSRIASVAGRGDRPAPQALVQDVGDAVAFLALTEERPPAVVVHPWSGVTTAQLLETLGGRRPVHLPATVCRAAVAGLRAVGRWRPGLAAQGRRLQVLWFGQEIAPSWLSAAGWTPPAAYSWQDLRRDIRSHREVRGDAL